VDSILKKYLFLLGTVFFLGCNSADDEKYSAKLEELKQQEKILNSTLDEQKRIIDLQQEKRLKQFVQLGGTEEEFKRQLKLEDNMSTEEIIKSTEILKKQIEDQNRILSSLKEEASKVE